MRLVFYKGQHRTIMNKRSKSFKTPTLFAILLLLFVVIAFFGRSILPDYVVFSNDGPLGFQKVAWIHLPEAFLGQWNDLNSIGTGAAASLPNLTSLIRWKRRHLCQSNSNHSTGQEK